MILTLYLIFAGLWAMRFLNFPLSFPKMKIFKLSVLYFGLFACD